MRILMFVVVAALFSFSALAQTPASSPEPVPPSNKKPMYPITAEEQKLLDRGEIGETSYVVGAILGTWPIGFGVGHAIQGRYMEKGWIFTLGEAASIAVLIRGLNRCGYYADDWDKEDSCNDGDELVLIGALGFIGFKVWEIVDLWVTPREINERIRTLRVRQMYGAMTVEPGFIPLADGGMLGLRMSF